MLQDCRIRQKGNIKTLFHGVNGSRVLPTEKWIKADTKLVTDGGRTYYMSGFHVMKTIEDCNEYMKRFNTNRRTLVIAPCESSRLVKKPTKGSTPVYLVKKLKVKETT